jgi:hypothetical protein
VGARAQGFAVRLLSPDNDTRVPLDKVEGFVKAHYSYAVREHR